MVLKVCLACFKVPSNNLFGSAYDADSEGEEGKYYTFLYDEIKNIKDIEKYFDIKPYHENKITLQNMEICNHYQYKT